MIQGSGELEKENLAIITDSEMAGLLEDDKLAFVTYEEQLRSKTRDNVGPDDRGSHKEREYANHVLAFVDVADLGIPVNKQPPLIDGEFWPWYHKFIQIVDYHTVKFRLAHARFYGKGMVSTFCLSDDYKTRIHNLLERVRKVVNQADFLDDKKDAIYKMIAELQAQVDRSGTLLSAFLSRFLDLTNAFGEGAENLEPAVKLLEHVMKVLGLRNPTTILGSCRRRKKSASSPNRNPTRRRNPIWTTKYLLDRRLVAVKDATTRRVASRKQILTAARF